MTPCTKEHFEDIIRTAARNLMPDFTRADAEKIVRKYFPRQEFMSKSELAAYLCDLFISY